jgi:hypothetical protein
MLGLLPGERQTFADDSGKQPVVKETDGASDKSGVNPVSKTEEKKTERESEKDKSNGNGVYPSTVPQFSLKDASGAAHSSEELHRECGMLLMLTVPNMTQCERQKRWEKWIKKEGWPEQNAPRCVVIEDMSQQETYKDRARRAIEDKSKEDSRTLFLVDETGDVRRNFGIEQNETVILIIDSSGTVIHNEGDEVEPERESAHRVAQQVRKLAQQNHPQPQITAQPDPQPVAAVKTQVVSVESPAQR